MHVVRPERYYIIEFLVFHMEIKLAGKENKPILVNVFNLNLKNGLPGTRADMLILRYSIEVFEKNDLASLKLLLSDILSVSHFTERKPVQIEVIEDQLTILQVQVITANVDEENLTITGVWKPS
jgi:hypothetical protein